MYVSAAPPPAPPPSRDRGQEVCGPGGELAQSEIFIRGTGLGIDVCDGSE